MGLKTLKNGYRHTSAREAWFNRLLAEKEDLDKKIRNLASHISCVGKNVDKSHIEILSRQKRAMVAYSDILSERIKKGK